MRTHTTVLLAALVLLAGCSAGPLGTPTPQEEPAPVMLVNNATVIQTFEVGVVDEGNNLTAIRGGTERVEYTVGPGSSTIANPDTKPFTDIRFPDSSRIIGRYTLKPGENTTLSIDKVAPNQAIVVLVYDESEGTYRAIKSLSCGGAIVGYKVVTKAGGPDDWTPSVHECKPDFPI